MVGYSAFKHPSRPASGETLEPVAEPPPDCSDPEFDRKKQAIYAKHLLQVVEDLCDVGVGAFWGRDEPPNRPPPYDRSFWYDSELDGRHVFVLKKGKSPTAALKALLEKKAEWKLDCAAFAQTCLALTLMRAVGESKFENIFSDAPLFHIGQHDSTPNRNWADFLRFDPREPFTKLVDRRPCSREYDEAWLFENAPPGTLFLFKNDHQPEGADYQHEHTLKLDQDKFAALGLAQDCMLTEKELREALAETTRKKNAKIGESIPDYAARTVWLKTVRYFNLSVILAK